jgi:hypothetical protein
MLGGLTPLRLRRSPPRAVVLAILLAVAAVTFPPATLAAPATIASAWALPADISPPVPRARADRERMWADRCIGMPKATLPRSCVYGDPNGSYTVALVGDSHISHFFPAFERVALERGWRLIVMVKVSCPLIDMPIRYIPEQRRHYTQCATWNENVIARLAKSPPHLTVVGFSHFIYPMSATNNTAARKAAAVARMLRRLPGRTVLLADSLVSAVDVPVCLAANPHDIRLCATPRRRAYRGHAVIEGRAAAQAGVPMIDIADRICSGDPCPAVVDRMILYRDTHHLTATFTRSLASDVARLLDGVR